MLKKTTTSVPQTNNNFLTWLHFHVTLRGLKANTTYFFFFHVPIEQLLNPSVHLASLTALGSCTRPPLMPVDCLWQALMQTPWLPWAITLNTQERARAGLTCGRVRGREGARETEGEEHLERGRKRKNGRKEKHPTANSRLCKILFFLLSNT